VLLPLATEHDDPHAPQLSLVLSEVSQPSAGLLLQSLKPALHVAT
jgi:hypothetical protein